MHAVLEPATAAPTNTAVPNANPVPKANPVSNTVFIKSV